MSMVSNAGRSVHIVDGVTTIDCQKQVRSWRLLRSLIEFLIPRCNCHYLEQQQGERRYTNIDYYSHLSHTIRNTTTVIGTIFGYRHGKVSFCVQAKLNNTVIPILLLELAVPTSILAKEMQHGLLRIALESNSSSSSSSSLLSVPLWSMCCNGRKVGLAVKRQPTQGDMNILRRMQNVSVGTGVIGGSSMNRDHDLLYLRANFQRVSRSADSESYHLISPDGNTGQELSIFFHRAR